MTILGAKLEMEGDGSQSSPATEISQLMDTAVSISRQKEIAKKTKATEAKIRRQVKKFENAKVESSQTEEGSDGGGTGGTKWFQPGELSIMIDHLESNYQLLFGNCKKADYKQQRVKAWQKLIEDLNVWNEHSGTNVSRDVDTVKRKIDNMKQRGIFLFIENLRKSSNGFWPSRKWSGNMAKS